MLTVHSKRVNPKPIHLSLMQLKRENVVLKTKNIISQHVEQAISCSQWALCQLTLCSEFLSTSEGKRRGFILARTNLTLK